MGAESLHPRVGFAAGLQRAVYQVIVGLVANGTVGARDVFGVNAEPGLRTSGVLLGERPRRMEIDAVEHCVFIVDRGPYMCGMWDGRNDLVERHQHHIHVPHDVASAGIAAGADHEAEIRRDDLVQRRDDPTTGFGVAAVQKSEMRRVKAAFECLKPVAFLNVAGGVALGWRDEGPFELRKCRLVLGRAHIGPYNLAAFQARIGFRF